MHSPHDPIHQRDFADMVEQVRLREAPTDADGTVRFGCDRCGWRHDASLAELLARYGPEFGLVNLLNDNLPAHCRAADRQAPGAPQCGLHYLDLR